MMAWKIRGKIIRLNNLNKVVLGVDSKGAIKCHSNLITNAGYT